VDDLILTPPCYVRALRVLGEIRDGISDLGGSRVNAEELIDVRFIGEQAQAGAFTWDNCRALACRVVAQIQRMQAQRSVVACCLMP
jgi:hypothetical protein